jgi:hypothetical protein
MGVRLGDLRSMTSHGGSGGVDCCVKSQLTMEEGAEFPVCRMEEFCAQLGALAGAEWARHSSAMRGSVKARPAGDDACDDCSVLGDWGVTFGTFQAR